MRKILAAIIAVLIFSSNIHAATYYVSTTGSNTYPYDTWAKAANSPHTIYDLNPSGGPHTIYVAPGTYYTGASYINHANWNGVTVQGTTSSGSVYPATEGQVIFHADGTNNNVFRIGVATGVTLNDVTLQAAVTGRANLYIGATGATFNRVIMQNAVQDGFNSSVSSGTITMNDCKLINNGRYAGIINGASAGATWVFNRLLSDGNAYEINNSISALATFNYSVFRYSTTAQAMRIQAPTTINNSLFYGNATSDIIVSGNNSQAVVINNTIFLKTGNTSTGYYFIDNDSTNATVTLNNTVRSTLWTSRTWAGTDGTITADNVSVAYKGPLFNSPRRPCIIVVGVDDANSADGSPSVGTIASKAEARGYRITWYPETNGMTESRWAIALDLHNRGHEIGNHTATHADLTTLTDEQRATEFSTAAAAIVAHGITAPTTLAYPLNAFNDATKASASAYGFVGARGGTASTQYLFSSLGKYTTYAITPGTFGLKSEAPTEAQIRARVQSMLTYLEENGGMVQIYAHNGSYDYDFEEASWDYFFDEISKSSCKVMTFRDAMAYVAANADSTTGSGGTLAYVRTTYTGYSADYRMKPGSPAINAGTLITGLHDAAGCVDFAGRPCVRGSAPDIGPYERGGGGLMATFTKFNMFAPHRRLH